MKQAMKLFAMAALAMAVVAATACSKDDEQAESTGTVVSTTTVSLADGNKALTSQGVKTFNVGDEVAVVYENNSGTLVKATVTLAEADISNGGKTASLTVTMQNPKSDGIVKIIYPAAMATDAGAVNYAALANQDGTLETIASSLDLAFYEGTLDGTVLPANPALANPLAVCEFQIKNTTGSTDLTPSVTMLYIADGTNSYYLSGLSGLSSIWVVMKPVESSATLTFHAAAGNTRYEKEISGKTLAAGNMYHVAVGTTQLREGALFGTFSVGGGKKVHFSQGNLKYTNGTWSFHTNQYDYLGVTGQDMTTDNIDLFGWVGASSTALISAPAKYGVSTSKTPEDYGTSTSDTLKADWGTLAISNGGNTINSGWKTLTGGSGAEWHYLFDFDSRTASTVGGTANGCYAKATVADKVGIILFPDVYTHPTDVDAPASVNTPGAAFTVNTYDAAAWAKMEAAGAVFLPAAGCRKGSPVSNAGATGLYWSSSPDPSSPNNAYYMYIHSNGVDVTYWVRRQGRSVRLVCPVE